MFDLNGKTALVTGATQGIGFEIAKILSEHGAKVWVNGASSMEKCVSASEKIKNSQPLWINLADENCAGEMYKKTGDIDILVLNASVQIRKPWNEITADEFDRQIKINLKSSLELIQRYAGHMMKNGWGRIVTVGSIQQYKPHKDMAVYAASKAAQMSIAENFAKQFAPFGVTVNNLSPGVIVTPRNDAALADKEYEKQVLAGIPMGYAGNALDCAAGALLLCSNEGRYITGTDMIIDGGMHL